MFTNDRVSLEAKPPGRAGASSLKGAMLARKIRHMNEYKTRSWGQSKSVKANANTEGKGKGKGRKEKVSQGGFEPPACRMLNHNDMI